MSRFNVNISKFEQSSLSDSQTRELFTYIEKKLPDLIRICGRAIKYVLRNNLDYRLITVGNDYVIVIRKTTKSSSSICIGYPFPIMVKKIYQGLFDGFCVNYYIRGDKLRNAQRMHLLQKLKENNKNFSIKFCHSKFGLRFALQRYIKTLKPYTLYYLDLYRFIGDSFLSTYMLDAFAKELNIKQSIVLSQHAQKLSGFYKTMDLNDWDKVSDNGIYIFSDLLDIDDAWVHEFAVKQAKNGVYILNSRNSFFVKNEDTVQYFAIKNKPDILLTRGNIFAYMNRSISSFIKTKLHIYKKTIKIENIKRIYINPFSSSIQKSFSEQEMFYLVKQLKTDFPYVDIFIPFGYDVSTKIYSIKISKKLNLKRLKDKGFYDLINKLRSNHIDLIITPDTALTHIATKCNIKNIVVFKSGFWDPLSLQSLAAESPLSFISPNPYQLPIVLSSANNKDFHKVSDVICLIQKVNSQKIDKIYNFCSFKFSLFDNIILFKLRKILGLTYKLKYYKKRKTNGMCDSKMGV
ncbi:MAG: hypothetical protein IKP24_02485 [Alphaproteobacteria bacterium]|nr:hypothetical protein [Alphaproteobacteria bacterium]